MFKKQSKVREGILKEWDDRKFIPLEWNEFIENDSYRVTPNGRIVKGVYFGEDAGKPLKEYYDKTSERYYTNIQSVGHNKIKFWKDELIKKYNKFVGEYYE